MLLFVRFYTESRIFQQNATVKKCTTTASVSSVCEARNRNVAAQWCVKMFSIDLCSAFGWAYSLLCANHHQYIHNLDRLADDTSVLRTNINSHRRTKNGYALVLVTGMVMNSVHFHPFFVFRFLSSVIFLHLTQSPSQVFRHAPKHRYTLFLDAVLSDWNANQLVSVLCAVCVFSMVKFKFHPISPRRRFATLLKWK